MKQVGRSLAAGLAPSSCRERERERERERVAQREARAQYSSYRVKTNVWLSDAKDSGQAHSLSAWTLVDLDISPRRRILPPAAGTLLAVSHTVVTHATTPDRLSTGEFETGRDSGCHKNHDGGGGGEKRARLCRLGGGGGAMFVCMLR